MLTIKEIDGIKVKSWIPFATFNGTHNHVKSTAWLFLHVYREHNFSLKELSDLSGIRYHSLGTLLPKWVRWGYVTAFDTTPRSYKLADRGRKWLDRWYSFIPASIKAELEAKVCEK